MRKPGNIYTRITNPTTAALEGGVEALATASGMTAVTYTILAIAHAGDHVVAASTIYGGTFNLLKEPLPRYGITTTFFDIDNLEEVEAAIKDNTKLVLIETLGNPLINIPDLEKLAEIAHKHQIPLVSDNTFAPEFKIEVSILKDVATVMIDTTGSSLFKRGYRTEKGGAPIKENMAAAILQLSNWYPDKPLIDPTCGSGTFCIEAVMIARKMAPGLRRSFAFEEWNWISDRLIQEVRTEAAKKVDRELELDIMGCDIDARMVEIAKANAQVAGVAGDITFKQMRVQDLRSDKINGVIISNPPYGERLSDDAGVTKLYAEMGQVFAPLKTWSKFILTSDEAFESKYGSQADKKRKLYNGTLKVDLYQYFGQRVKRQEVK
ncbi:N-6 adenine-specific DNA methylase [Streptococcus pneumoniae]|nr:N-6 adenine-specific DNA methylase [Streptococcus pneumoniae]